MLIYIKKYTAELLDFETLLFDYIFSTVIMLNIFICLYSGDLDGEDVVGIDDRIHKHS